MSTVVYSNLRSGDLYARATRVLPRGNTRSTVFVPPHPPYIVRGLGCRMTDADGHTTIDLQGNYTALIHGHAHPEIVTAAEDALRDGASFGLPTSHEIELAEELSRRVPAGERWRFTNSGTEAVMMAVRVARAATGRDMVLRFAGAYHGTADVVVDADAPGIPAGVASDVLIAEPGDWPGVERALERHGERLACVVLDAMPNRAGLRPAEAQFVTRLRAATEACGALLIQDEVLTFRLARGGLHSLYGIRPDLVTLGKLIGGGFPVGAVGGRTDVMARFDPTASDSVAHGGTFSANPVTMRAGLVALALLTDDEIARINGLGDRLRSALTEQGWLVAGQGSLLRIHVQVPHELWWRLYREGVAIATNGLACISTAMDDATIATVEAAFAQVAPGVLPR